MNKGFFKKLICLCLGVMMAMSATACGGGSKTLDTETRPLMLAIGAPDTNFNPFFSTSLVDSQIAGMTQASMLSIDEEGDVVCGEDWPSVALDYSITSYDRNGQISKDGDIEGETVYQFLIKKGMKFSDGKDLTIKDALFSLYVFLDPAYTGSATIYSTDIKGLNAYRAQNPNLTDDDSYSESRFYADAGARVTALVDWSTGENTGDTPSTEQARADLATVKKLFAEEAETDWVSIESSWESSFEESYSFNAAWEAYLYNEGIVEVQTKINEITGGREQVKDADGKYVTTLQPDVNTGETRDAHLAEEIANATTSSKVQAYMAENNCSEDYAILQLQKECAVNMVVKTYTAKRQIAYVLTYWATATTALEDFAADARSKYYEGLTTKVESISGIKAKKVTTFTGENGTHNLDGEYDVLEITINGVDPKAIFNFAFTVAPMHYYSSQECIDAANRGEGYGVKIGNKEFFSDVLKGPKVNGLPVGAGAYKASSEDGSEPQSKNDFFKNNIVYYERNEYFHTMGAEIENANIKYLRYKVMGDEKIIDALLTKEIDYGEPNAKRANLNKLTNAKSYLTTTYYPTSGYGYVGINPKYVPDVKIRQAIMKAMDTSGIIRNYYNEELASLIYRPMSTTSWAYPDGIGEYESIKYDPTGTEIDTLVKEAGYVKDASGKYYNRKTGEKLKFTFTIAGESIDHPAYDMFCDARDYLNGLGWDITVSNDIQALKKLTTGSLEVWAAAWSSGVDPDMYQIYHKDSKATSVNNWNCSGILNEQSKGDYEYDIVMELAELIEKGREVNDRARRSEIYADCLDLIMDMAVELPTYQRADLCAYNKNVIDSKSLPKSPNHNIGVLGKIWEVDYI